MTSHQLIAADPSHSAWVSASAGTGKTKVLTDRVLRLLLRNTAPERILCLTYTNAAAAEMKNRLQETLARWAISDDSVLQDELEELLNTKNLPDEIPVMARTLFARLLDSSEGVRIQTIHSLCQHLLRRFPLEAGVDPHFSVLDGRSEKDMLEEAKLRLLSREHHRDLPHLTKAIAAIAADCSEENFSLLLKEIIGKRNKFLTILQSAGGVIRTNTTIYEALGITYGTTFAQLRQELKQRIKNAEDDWRQAAEILDNSGKKDRERAAVITDMLSFPDDMEKYFFLCLLTGKNTPLSQLVNKSVAEKNPSVEKFLRDEQEWCVSYYLQRWLNLKSALNGEYLVALAESLLLLYQQIKTARGFMDYNDLIIFARRLLRQPGIAPWVLHKLDGGLDHLLVDEAQDTSPEQWDIVRALIDDFFSGDSARGDSNRTLFVVGDEKQSIFSFQGADPYMFQHMREFFGKRIAAAKKEFRPVSLFVSFRSAPAILKAVDAIFSGDEAKDGVLFAEKEIRHEAYRNQHAGKVELLPLFEPYDKDEMDAWQVATAYQYDRKPSWRLAQSIAETIGKWLDKKRIIAAKGRAIEPRDIMILVQRRGALVNEIIAALKKRNVAVAGIDRLQLLENIAVKDMMALANFLLLPQDDLSLAELLKSPLFSIDEDELYTLACSGRREKKKKKKNMSLWQSLREYDGTGDKIKHAATRLQQLLTEVDYISPYELFSRQLEEYGGRKSFAARMGEEVNDPLDEFLQLALAYEKSYPPVLQGFIHWMQRGDMEVKRDMEQVENQVRVMTVHSAKGLQAPVVMLADTTHVPMQKGGKTGEMIISAEHNGWTYFTLNPSETDSSSLLRQLREERKKKRMQEYRRLFYVALTRAEDELYIYGYSDRETKKVIDDDCWYSMAKRGIGNIADKKIMRESRYGPEGEILHIGSQQEIVLTCDKATGGRETPEEQLPVFAVSNAPDEPTPPRPLIPSQTQEAGGDVIPMAAIVAAQRGRVIHSLLQYAPSLPDSRREQAIDNFLQRQYPAPDSSVIPVIEEIKNEVMKLLRHPQLKRIFSANALVEVPVTGIVTDEQGGRQVISGQIDRLLVEEDQVLIIDYKTGNNIPDDNSEIPQNYIRQMDNYSRLIAAIYPDKTIKAALLWTAEPKLMPVTDNW